MLTFLFHPIDEPRVVEEDEAEKMLASGVWFDSPLTAKQYREKVEQEIKNESKSEKTKTKLEDKHHEKSSNV